MISHNTDAPGFIASYQQQYSIAEQQTSIALTVQAFSSVSSHNEPFSQAHHLVCHHLGVTCP